MNDFYFKTILVSLTFLLAQLGISQPIILWDKTYGGTNYEELHAIFPTNDDGFILAGSTFEEAGDEDVSGLNQGDWDFWVVKVDKNGDLEWENRIGGDGEDRLWAVIQTQDNGYLLGGGSRSNMGGDKTEDAIGGMDYWIVKLDENGQQLWDKTLGGTREDRLRGGVLEAIDGGFLLAGFSDSNQGGDKSEDSFGEADYWVIKTDDMGNLLWDKTYGGEAREQMFALTKTNDAYIMGGDSQSNIGAIKDENLVGVTDWWIIKLDVAGNLVEQKTIGGVLEDVMLDILPTSDSGYIACGKSLSPAGIGKQDTLWGKDDFWLVKLDENLNIEWDKTYGGVDTDIAYDVRETARGSFVVAGVSESNISGNRTDELANCKDYWIVGFDVNGQKLWDRGYGGDDCDALADFDLALDGSFLLAGHSSSDAAFDKSQDSKGFNDYWIIKTACGEPENLVSDTTFCSTSTFTITAHLADCDSCTFVWDDGTLGATRVVMPNDGDSYKVTVTDDFGCILKDSIQLEVLPTPTGTALEVVYPNCYGDNNGNILVGEMESGTPPFIYALNEGSFQSAPLFDGLTAGNYDILIEDVNGCVLDTFVYLEQPNQLIVELGDDIILELGDSIQLQALTNQEVEIVSWNQPDLLSCPDCLIPYTRPLETAVFSVRVTNENGCIARDNIQVVVKKDRALYAPNIFSPDADGNNDYFMLMPGAAVTRINTLRIFDQWGELVYQADDIIPGQLPLGWDGRVNDRPLDPDVFVWFAEVVYFDSWVEMIRGDLTLVR